jgi:thiol-disulfide isomerase/thioredoxin
MSGRTLVIVALLAGAAGAAGYYFLLRPQPDATASAPAPTAPAPAAESAAPVARQLAATIPDFTLVDREGQPRSLRADWPGQSLIINFWATWCAPCRREIPLLKQLAADHAVENFKVIGIAVDFRDKVLAYADEMQIDYPMLIGEQDALDAANAFGVEAVGLPFTIFTDSAGRVIALHMGELTAGEADIILAAVREVNAGRSDPLQARAAIEAGLAAMPPESADKNAG